MASKRRSGPAGSPAGTRGTPDPKRRKRNDDTHFPDEETVETTTELGIKLVQQLKRSQDKTGRNVAGHFLDLPSRTDYPDYYQQIAMPISLNMIEQRLEDGDYDNMERLESDLKRMVQNAKDYNDSKSEVFEDAERIRKALSNFMPKHNPAYLNSDYRAYPTPIPQALLDRIRESSASTASNSGPEKVKLVFSGLAAKRRQSQPASTDADGEEEEDVESNVRTEQLELLSELSKQEDAINFEEKPLKKEYPEYYKIIQRPTSISDVRGMVSRSRIRDWNSLAREVRLIWDNAKEFNETGSPIYEMAHKLEKWFDDKVQARGAQPRIVPRLSLSQPKPKQLKLTMGASTPTPTVAGVTIDNESLRRQKEEMGQALNRANRASSRSVTINGSTPAPPITHASLRRSASTVEPADVQMSGMNGSATPQPVAMADLARAPLPPLRQLPTPAMDGEPPAAFAPTGAVNGHRPQEVSFAYPARNIYAESDNPIERKFRDPGKGLQDALLGSVTYMTHPNLPNDPKWKISRYASPTKTQTSSFIYLPSDHFYIRLIPNLTAELRSRRNHKLCVSQNWQVVPVNPHVPGVFDLRLAPGENVIAVDVIADLKEGERKEFAPPQLQVDFERITFIIFLVDRPVEP